MKTSIILDMRYYAHHGVLPQERTVGNLFEVSLVVNYPFEEAMASDDLSETLNYADIETVVHREMDIPSKLLEHVVGRIIAALQKEFPKISGGRIKLTKVKPPIAGDVKAAVEVEW